MRTTESDLAEYMARGDEVGTEQLIRGTNYTPNPAAVNNIFRKCELRCP